MGFYADVAIIKNQHGIQKEVPLELWNEEKRREFPRWTLIEIKKSEEPEVNMSDTEDMADEDLYALIENKYKLTPPVKEKASRLIMLDIIRKYREKQLGKRVMREARERREELRIIEEREAFKVQNTNDKLMSWHEAMSQARQIAKAKNLDMPKKQDMASVLEFIKDNK